MKIVCQVAHQYRINMMMIRGQLAGNKRRDEGHFLSVKIVVLNEVLLRLVIVG